MDLSFARRSRSVARPDLGSLLATVAVEQAVTSTATLLTRAETPQGTIRHGDATIDILLASWIKPSVSIVPSFNASVAHTLMTPRQPL